MHYDYCTAPYKKLAEAWNLFTDTGTFNKGVPRIDEYTSWVRCRHENICGPVVPLDDDQLAQKQIINEQLISNARPVIDSVDNILQRSLKSNYAVFLMDSEGLIIDIDYRGNDEIPVGNRCIELYACNNAVEISSQEKKIVEVYGYEHLYPQASDWHTIGDLVFNYDKSIAGGLGIVSEVNSVSSIVPILRIGSQLIRSNLVFTGNQHVECAEAASSAVSRYVSFHDLQISFRHMKKLNTTKRRQFTCRLRFVFYAAFPNLYFPELPAGSGNNIL